MAFRTNKVPAIEERTVSGSSVSFNTAFALPLKKCVVSFMATQSGSGTPSPQNKRPIVPVSSVDLSANTVSVIVPLGDSYGGGTLDLLTGKAVITHKHIYDMSGFVFSYNSTNKWFTTSEITDIEAGSSSVISDILCSEYIPQSRNYIRDNLSVNYLIAVSSTKAIIIRNLDYDYSTINDFENSLSDVGFCYSLETPIELTLTPTQLSSIIGNNTFSTDIGTLEITYKDLDIAKRGSFREVFKLPS